jgi:iron complex transport system substrate-binding protein
MRAAPIASTLILLCRLAAEASPSPSGSGIVATDSLGRRVTIAAPASRIVCLSPGACESLFAIGSGAEVIAVTAACDYPEEAKLLSKVDEARDASIDAGGILSLKPDLVVTAGPRQREIDRKLVEGGLAVFAYSPTELEGIARSIMALGTLTGKEKASIVLASVISRAIRRLGVVTASIPTARKPSVFWLSSREPLETSGRDSLQQAILDAAGGRNAFFDFRGEGNPVSAEEVARRSPQFIVVPIGNGDYFETASLASLPLWAAIPAIRDGRVFAIPESSLSRGGPRVATGLLALAKDLHPELFP